MNQKEVNEIKKAVSGKYSCISTLEGWLIGDDGNILSRIREPFLAMPEDTAANYIALFKKALTGKAGKKLFGLPFPASEEAEGGRQECLYRLYQSSLKDKALLGSYFDMIRSAFHTDGRFLILSAYGEYDVPGKASDGTVMEDASDYIFPLILTMICPVTAASKDLLYEKTDCTFVDGSDVWTVQAPAVSWLFPSFTDRQPDIHECLYSVRTVKDTHPEIAEDVLGCRLPVMEDEQKSAFKAVIEKSLGRNCTVDNAAAIADEIRGIKERSDTPEEETLGKEAVRRLLRENGGIEDEKVFEQVFDDEIGKGSGVNISALVPASGMTIKSPGCSIKVAGDMTPMVKTAVINGREHIVIPVTSDMEVNGISVLISK